MSLIIQSAASRRKAAPYSPPPSGHRYWRVAGPMNCTDATYYTVYEMGLYDSGQNLLAAASMTCSHTPQSPTTLANLTDADVGSRTTILTSQAETAGFYYQWDFGAGNEKVVAYWWAYGYSSARWSADILVQYSDNGTDWTTQSTKTGLSYPGVAWSSYIDVTS